MMMMVPVKVVHRNYTSEKLRERRDNEREKEREKEGRKKRGKRGWEEGKLFSWLLTNFVVSVQDVNNVWYTSFSFLLIFHLSLLSFFSLFLSLLASLSHFLPLRILAFRNLCLSSSFDFLVRVSFLG